MIKSLSEYSCESIISLDDFGVTTWKSTKANQQNTC